MKRSMLKLSGLVLFALLGGAITTSVAKPPNGEVYDVNFSLYNTDPICNVSGLPSLDISDGSVDVLDYSVTVDGAGKITGFANLQLTSSDGTSTTMATVSGKMGNKGKSPNVNMTIKGPGFGTTGSADGKANVSIKFNGSPSAVGGDSVSPSYYAGYEMNGNVNGNFKPGIKGAKTVKVKNANGTISSSDVTSMTQIDSCILTLVAMNNKLTLGGCLDDGDGDLDFHYEWNGKGNANLNNGKFNFNLTGTGPMTGSKITVKGNSSTDSSGDVNLGSMSASGKVMGQKINADGEGYLTLESVPQ